MLVKQYYMTRRDGVSLYRTFSDAGMMIRKFGTDELYGEAIDVEDANFAYEETNIPIESEVEDLGLQQSDLPC